MILRALEKRAEGPIPWMEIETRDELIAAALGVEDVGWPERVRYARSVGLDAVGFAHWERFGCEVIQKGSVLGFKPKISSRADLSNFSMPEKLDFRPLKERVQRAKEAIGDTGLALFVAHVLCFDPVVMDMGLENFSIALYEDIDLIRDLYKRYTEYYRKLDEFYSSLPEIDFIWVGEDIAYNKGTFVHPDTMRELVFPYFEEITTGIDKPWVYHSDGDIGDVLPDLLRLGMNAIHPLEPGAMDIVGVKREYGDRVTLVGNVNVNTLTLGSTYEVKEEVRNTIDACSPGGGYILSSSNSLTNYVRPENVAAMGEEKRRWNNTEYPG